METEERENTKELRFDIACRLHTIALEILDYMQSFSSGLYNRHSGEWVITIEFREDVE